MLRHVNYLKQKERFLTALDGSWPHALSQGLANLRGRSHRVSEAKILRPDGFRTVSDDRVKVYLQKPPALGKDAADELRAKGGPRTFFDA